MFVISIDPILEHLFDLFPFVGFANLDLQQKYQKVSAKRGHGGDGWGRVLFMGGARTEIV